jgi:tRNA pseudouridine38-40 synthase
VVEPRGPNPGHTMTDAAEEKQNWKLTVSYDGTDYAGWQVQPGLLTVQGALATAIRRVVGEEVLPQGAGRTDAGVHAEGQVASFSLRASIEESNLLRAVNRVLPQSIRVLKAERVPAEFHARHCARAKTYIYTVYRGEICPPSLARYVYRFPYSLSFEAMQNAATVIEGVHDFTSFAATVPDLATRTAEEGLSTRVEIGNTRCIYSSRWEAIDADRWQYRVHGRSFLHHMVRNLVGTFLDMGRGRIPAGDMRSILERRARGAAGPTAPAQGLSLLNVEYGEADVERKA